MKRIKRVFLTFLAAAFIIFLPLSAQVRIEETEMEIPTYLTGADDPNPPLWDLRIYPYPMQTDITREKVMKRYRVVVIENDFIKLIVLPDIGGRILAALDKTNNNFDFIYYNHVIKPGLVALRGAWLSGGIEWNFPTLGHTVNTFSPVKYKILKNSDGSATCIVGTEEWVRRMNWEVLITLFPDRSYFRTTTRLYNRTLTHNNGYFWANAATHAWEDTRVFFPPAEYTYAGGRRNPRPWPVDGGKDVSWYKNTASPHDYFCGTPGDFNGAYNYDKDSGTVHCASWSESPGKKFWTWGTAPSGMIWEDLLTDRDGQYIEIQAGRLLTQGDSWIFEPHLVEEWEEWWYPVKKMHGLAKANPEAALNLEVRNKKVFIALNTTRTFHNAEVKLTSGEKEAFSEKLDISPAGYYRKEVEVKEKTDILRVEFLDENRNKIINYSTEKIAFPSPELEPSPAEEESDSPQVAYLSGYYSLKHWDIEGAMSQFEKALEKDAGFTPALDWLGIIFYRTGKIEEALSLFERALKRDEDDQTARYYRALCKMSLGISERCEEDLHMVSRRAAYRHVSFYALAALEFAKKNYEQAKNLLGKALRNNPDDVKASVMLAAAERYLGRGSEAEKLVQETLRKNPIDSLALLEKKLLSGESELEILKSDPEYYLEVASDYSEMNLIEDAVKTLEVYFENKNPKEYPLVYYYLGYFRERLGQKEEAEKYFKNASSFSPELVFPFRVETEKVLKAALKYNSSDWKAHYYLGNLLTAKLRWQEGLEHFEKAAESCPQFAVLYRNLGEIYWKKFKDYLKAEKMYEKAVAYSGDDYRLYLTLDELYAINNKHSEREKLYQAAPQRVKNNFNYVLKRAQYYLDTGYYSEALKILQTHTFLPWEGWTGAREVYVMANLKRAYSYFREGEYEKAKRDFLSAMEYPKNLGTGRPAEPLLFRENFFIGLCCEKLGDKKRAESYYKEVIKVSAGVPSEPAYYKALALKRMGKIKEGEELLLRMKSEAESLIELSRGKIAHYYLLSSLASYALGDREKAKKDLNKAVEIEPPSRWASLLALEMEILSSSGI